MQIYDSHTHLNDDPFYDDVPAFLARAAHLGVTQLNIVGSNRQLNARALKLSQTYPNLHAIVGWHPEDAAAYHDQAVTELKQQLAQPTVVGLGEIGLDYVNGIADHQRQAAVFAAQVALAKQFDLPIVIHSRDALADTYALMKRVGLGPAGGVMHSFSGDATWAARFLALGFDLSFSGVASFNRATDVQAAVQATPLDRLMVETDAPYLTPTPYRGKQNEPAYTYYVVQAVAQLKGLSPDQVAAATFANAARRFRKAGVSSDQN